MNHTDPMKSLLSGAFPSQEPGDALAHRVGQLRPRPPHRAPWIALGSAVAAAGGLTAVGLLVGTPSRALADVLLEEAQNIHGHILTYIVGADGKRTLADEAWLESDRARQVSHEPIGLTSIIDEKNGYDVYWNPFLHAFVFREGDIREQLQLGRLMYSGRLDELQKLPGFKAAKMKTGSGSFNGQTADSVELAMPAMRWIAYADPKSHKILGLRIYHQEPIPGTQRQVRRPGARGPSIEEDEHLVEREVVIGEQVADPELFKPIFDVDGVMIDAYKKRDEVRERLSQAIATYDSPSGPVVIRDVSMNLHGDVFVLWTGGNGPYGTNVIPMTVHDQTGGAYAKCWGFNPSMGGGSNWPGYSFDGKPLEGAWFAHVDGPVAAGPITIGFKKEFEPMEHLAFRHTQSPARALGAVPDYMLVMCMPVNPSSVDQDRDHVGAEYFTNTAKDYARGETLWRKVIAETETKRNEQSPMSHFSLGVCLEHERKYPEAISELTLAKNLALNQNPRMAGDFDHELRLTKRAAGLKP